MDVLKVDLLKLERELLRLHESEADVGYLEPDFYLSGSSVVERFDDSTIRAVLFAQRKAWEVEAAAVEVRHIILGLIHVDAYIAELFVGVDSEFQQQLTKTEFFGVSDQSSAIPFSAQVKEILEQSETSRASLRQRFVSPKHILAVLLSIPDVVTAEGLEKLLPNYMSLESLIRATPAVILPLVPRAKVDSPINVDVLPKPYDPTDDASTLAAKVIQWEAEAELCRKVEKEALIQAELCRQALADMF